MQKYDIVEHNANPNVAALIEAFAHAFDSAGIQTVTFPIIDHDTATAMARKGVEMRVHVQITSLAYDSGKSGEFLIGGNAIIGENIVGRVKGLYDTKGKIGFLDIE